MKKLASGFTLPALALGTWGMGGRHERMADYPDEAKDIAAIQKAYELGIRRFDTAQMYAEGYSEEILGKALHDVARADIFVTSKVSPEHLQYEGVIRSLEESLERLNMEYLDLYLIHKPNHEIPISETMKAFDALMTQGRIKNIGVSNFSVESLQEAQACSMHPIRLNQVHYNLLFREPVTKGLLAYCQQNDIFLEAWRPVQQGSLCQQGTKIVDDMAAKYGKTPAQIAINWLLGQDHVVTLFKSSDIAHVKENIGALGWSLEPDDAALLSHDFPIQLDRSNAVQLG